MPGFKPHAKFVSSASNFAKTRPSVQCQRRISLIVLRTYSKVQKAAMNDSIEVKMDRQKVSYHKITSHHTTPHKIDCANIQNFLQNPGLSRGIFKIFRGDLQTEVF